MDRRSHSGKIQTASEQKESPAGQKKEESIKKDSLNQFFEYSNLKKEYINLVSIKQNIDNFLNSNKRYKDKKTHWQDLLI